MLSEPTPAEEKLRLAALRELGVLDSAPEADFDSITTLAADCLGAPIALISLVDEDRQWFKSRHGLEVTETGRSVAFCGYTILADDTLVVLDASKDPRFCENPLVLGEPFIRFYAGAPLILGSGERVGTLCVIDSRPREIFTERDDRILRSMARQVVSHLETRQLRSQQRISQLIADVTTDAFVCTATDGRIIYWNHGAEAMFGHSTRDAVGRNLDIIVPPEHLGAHHAGMHRVGIGGIPRLVGKTIEVPAVRGDGTRLMIELTLGMWTDPESGLPAGFASVLRDVGQRKVTEAKLAEQVAAIEAAQEGISIADLSGINHYMNEAFLSLFGLPANAADVPWSHLVPGHERERLAEDIIRNLQDGGNWSGEMAGIGADGSLLDLEISLTRCGTAMVSVIRDISARRAEAREMARLREQLLVAQRQEMIGQLASGLAHDFNNLIASISGSAALIRASVSGETRRHAARVEAAAADAASLVEKMLSIGTRMPQYDTYDARSITRDVADLLRVSLQRGHSLHLDLDDEAVLLTADRTELVQVLLNLGLNARDALNDCERPEISLGIRGLDGPPEGVDLALGRMPAGPLALFYVEDNGCGMTADELRKIFAPFYTLKESSGGTGLGLTMVANIVAAVAGGISVHSTPGVGTRFDIYWPLVPPEKAKSGIIKPDDDGETSLVGATILLVDDEPSVVETLSAMLEQSGAEVGPCVEPADAIAALQDDPDAWTLLVTDYDMPGMNGAELAAAARAVRPDLPILLVTALPDAARTRLDEGELFDAISGKLVSVSGLAAAARAAISHRQAKNS